MFEINPAFIVNQIKNGLLEIQVELHMGNHTAALSKVNDLIKYIEVDVMTMPIFLHEVSDNEK